jgi:hypothetical protein
MDFMRDGCVMRERNAIPEYAPGQAVQTQNHADAVRGHEQSPQSGSTGHWAGHRVEEIQVPKMIESAQDFVRLRTSEHAEDQHRATHEGASEAVWLEVIAGYPEMRQWVAHNKTVPISILEVLHADPSANVRYSVARKRKLPERLQQALAADRDASVRRAVACNAKVSRAILQKLTADPEPFVCEVAIERLSAHGSNT